MKTIIHPDYWVEIPAGEVLLGLSDVQREAILAQAHRLNAAVYKEIEHSLTLIVEQKSVWLDRFYIARFATTHLQYGTFEREDISPGDLPGALEDPLANRDVAAVQSDIALQFCQKLGGRMPTSREWLRAARGEDARFYPWGNIWDFEAGFFYYGQGVPGWKRVDAFSRGVSFYGAWGMAGGLPELTNMGMGGRIGCHARESSAETAWFDHILVRGSAGDWISLRPVLDKWPPQHLTGFQAGLTKPNAAALQKMGPLADLLLTQYRWSTLETKLLDTLEPAIVAVREARKDEAQELLAEILHNDDTLEAAWLLQAAALADVPRQRESVQRALALNPESEVGPKLAALLKEPPRVAW